ncbi:DUF4012 domain-containing protein [Microbacterium sp.]|uniref:DUF4012 domain-containing protein n=1 Tax=Microbacterium sp. TaxID=51671 RepID=UPI0037C71CDA
MSSPARRPSRVVGRAFMVSLAVVAVAGLAAAAWIGVRALAAEGELRSAQASVSELRQILATDPAGAADSLEALAQTTSRARALTSDIIWQAAESLPWVGPQLAAVSTVTRSLDNVVQDSLPLVESAGVANMTRFTPVDGAVDTAALTNLQAPAIAAASSAQDAARAVDGIDRNALLTPLVAPVEEAAGALEQMSGLTDAFARTSQILPAVLGADGPRSYLIMMQNNAEWRSLGGIPGAAMVLKTDAGRMEIVEQVTAGDLTNRAVADIPLDPEVESLFGVRPGRWFQNTTQVPDFAVAGPLAAGFWERATGEAVDGVISVDPVVLSYVLGATGPITLSTGDTLDSGNAVSFLVNEVYLKYPIAETDAIFAEAAASVFQALVSGGADPARILPALVQGIEERRVLLWSADPAEQDLLAGTPIAGGLPISDEETAQFGVYVNEGGGAKIDYYLALGADAQRCADGRVNLRVTIHSDAPQDVEDYPAYIHADGNFGVDPRLARTISYVYLPAGATVVSAEPTVGGLGGQRDHGGLRVVTWESDLAPGETATLDVIVDLPGTQGLDVVTTPTINTLDIPSVSDFCDLAEY